MNMTDRDVLHHAYECAENCDICWWLMSVETYEAQGDEKTVRMLRVHFDSGHYLNSEEIEATL
jgi:hypothetical protein